METISVRDTHAVAPSPVPASRTRGRWVLLAAFSLIALQLGLRGWVVLRRNYYADDLRLLQLAEQYPLFSPDYLLYDFDGHLMPGGFLVAGLVQRAAPLEWWPAAVSLIVLQALASLALLRLLRVLLGSRPVLLVPLAFGLFTPLALGSLTWWAAALNSLPLQIALAWCVADAVQLARTGRRRHALSGTAALAFGLAFYIKAVLLPPIAFVFVVVVLLRDGVRSPILAALRRAWTLWFGMVVVLGIWALTYVSTRESDPVNDGSTSDVILTITTGYKALAPSVLGGPFEWSIRMGGAPLAQLPTWSVIAGGVVLSLACLWTSVRLRGAPTVWALVVGAAGAGLLMAALGRSGAGWGDILPLAYRYFPAESVLLPAAGALLLTLPTRSLWLRSRDDRARPGRVRPRVLVPLVAVLTAGFVVTAVLSTISHSRAWEDDPAAAYLDAARASLAAAGPTPLLDQPVPSFVLWASAAPVNQASRVFGPVADRPEFATSTSELLVLDEAGQLRPAQVVPGPLVVDGPVPGCGWAVAAEGGTSVDLQGPLPEGEWTAQLDYVADRDGTIEVVLGTGEAVRAPVSAGRNTVWIRLSGEGSALLVTPQTPELGLCVEGGLVGAVAVR
ncbi:hypothetical protein [Blastococcus goldschmidtiae]|uniref:4-amino-4-deoxy-L-arabinose transferase n=1 Tax=Blastococcus goldschmidtiae TaxID=3075546 RepID=A0ABU2K7S7_9ACTN|nr:hypothetical protein [Blastococcus sp. DSM 46792]MDT0276246.1 hypothetical protein [Blastococcus sp. DSM 46792]